jgi:hypothetical protein
MRFQCRTPARTRFNVKRLVAFPVGTPPTLWLQERLRERAGRGIGHGTAGGFLNLLLFLASFWKAWLLCATLEFKPDRLFVIIVCVAIQKLIIFKWPTPFSNVPPENPRVVPDWRRRATQCCARGPVSTQFLPAPKLLTKMLYLYVGTFDFLSS